MCVNTKMKISITWPIVDLSSSQPTVCAVFFQRVRGKIESTRKSFSFFNRNCLHNVIMMSKHDISSKMKPEEQLKLCLKAITTYLFHIGITKCNSHAYRYIVSVTSDNFIYNRIIDNSISTISYYIMNNIF